MSVTALLVSHEGSRWLPQVLDRLARQTERPTAVVAVDSGPSSSDVPALRAGLPDGSVVLAEPGTTFPAAILVRRSVLEELGLDDELPVLHSDLDFGRRAARAGHRVRTVPDAVVFHAEASRNGTRPPRSGRAERRRVERAAALYTVLVNCVSWAVPLVAARLLLGTVLRAVGLLLVRAPREAWAELRALGATLLRPGRLARARRARRRTSHSPTTWVLVGLGPAGLVLVGNRSEVQVAAGDEAVTLQLVMHDGRGRELLRRPVNVPPAGLVRVRAPAGAAYALLLPRSGGGHAAAVQERPGLAVQPVTPLPTTVMRAVVMPWTGHSAS